MISGVISLHNSMLFSSLDSENKWEDVESDGILCNFWMY